MHRDERVLQAIFVGAYKLGLTLNPEPLITL